MFLVMNFDAKL